MMIMNNQPLLEVRNLKVEIPTRKGTLIALEDVSFNLKAGEILGVVGESGAGKSMVGNSIIGLLGKPAHITHGEILLEGKRIDNLSDDEMEKIRGKNIGAIFQDPLTSLNPLFTIGDQLIETIRIHSDLSEKEARERAIRLLVATGVPAADKRMDNYPHQFSGGMRQRVVIALALSADPKLIIADEPTTALDVSVQAQIIELLKKLCEENGTAVILVTHDVSVIAETADRVAVMYAGRLAEIGPVEEMIHDAEHPYTIGLMGSIPKIGDEQDRLSQISGAMPHLSEVPSGCAFHPRCPLAEEKCIRERPVLHLVNLSKEDKDKYPHQFSGGQRQRISIARAIAIHPEFLVCDEPTTALDVSVQAQVLNLMQNLQREVGLTYLFISHNLSIVHHISDRVGVMYLGRLVELADKRTLFNEPRHPYTRMLLDAIPDLSQTHRRRTPISGEVPNPLSPPTGCPFHPRCPLANERCRKEMPLRQMIDSHGSFSEVACHAAEEGRL